LGRMAAGVGAGAEVITTPMTFVATVNAIEYVGARPRFVDIDPQTLLLEPAAAEEALTSRTKAIMPVSFGGRPLDVDGYLDLAERRNMWIIEDAAHAIGAVAAGRHVGADRHPRYLTCFSFYPNKNLASAEGGAITTSEEGLALRLQLLRLHGLDTDAWARYHAAPRTAVVDRMRGNGLGAAVHYIVANLHPRFRHFATEPLPYSDAASRELISLPLHPGLGERDVVRVVTGLDAALRRATSCDG